MKKYNVFYLWVVEKDGHKFICERIYDNRYKEVLTKEDVTAEENDKVKSLTRCYSILEIATYKNGQILNPLMLTKKDILLKYIEINQNVIDKRTDINEFLKKQQEELEGLQILAKECPELARKYSLEKLQEAGILDENGDLKEPYNELVTKKSDIDIAVDMWQEYVEEHKDDMPDIPIINAKELHKQKTLDKK